MTFEEPYDVDNIASHSSKMLILDKFVKSFEICIFKLFNNKFNQNANFNEFCTILFSLGFVKYDQNNQKEVKKKGRGEKEIF